MDAKTWQRAQQIFDEAIEKPAGERAALVSEACAGDAELGAQVEKLLRAHESAGDFLKSPTFAAPTEPAAPDEHEEGSRIGPYKLLERIGEGGFAVVYMAEQQTPAVRKVAVKIVKPGMDTKQVIARFDAERQALAMMDHPHIAQVYDAGATESGRPYFAMELVRGVPISEYCDEHQLSVRERLELLVLVCQAVQHAHQKGIIHRDLKPSNVLVARHDGAAVPKVIDFGIAKAMHARLTDKTVFTEFRQLIGTPAYMSPEQAELSGLDIDTRSDVYSLGVLLYELLTGQPPFDSRTLREAPLDELRRVICEVEPPTPSTRVSSLMSEPEAQESVGAAGAGSSVIDIARQRRTDPRSLTRFLRGDLDWIVMKCLEKDRKRRYQSAAALAEDVERHLTHQPIQARPPSAIYQLKKLIARHKAPFAFIAAMLVLTVCFGIWMTVLYRQAGAERDRAIEAEQLAEEQLAETNAAREAEHCQREQAEAVTEILQDMLSSADPHEARGRDYTVLQLLDDFGASLGDQLEDQPEVEAAIRATMGNAYRGLGEYEKAELHLNAALVIRRRTFGEEHELVARSIHDWGWLLHDKGDYPGAKEALHDALDMRRRVLGQEHEEVAEALQALSHLLIDQAAYEAAEPMAREALAMRRNLLGEEHLDVANSLSNLAYLLRSRGDAADAERLYREALEMRRKVLGSAHPELAENLYDLAVALIEQNDHAGAEPFYREALEMHRELYGDEHPDIAMDQAGLAETLYDKGDEAEAEALLREAVAMQRKLLGDEHPDLAGNLNRLALWLQFKHDAAGAEALFREALEMRLKLLGDGNPATCDSLTNLAQFLNVNGRPAEAEPFARQALEGMRRTCDDDSERVLCCMHNLALVLSSLGKFSEAEALYQTILETEWRTRGNDHPETIRSMHYLAWHFLDTGKLSEAEPLFREALELSRRVHGEEHPETLGQMHGLATALRRMRRFDEAEQLLRQVLDIRRRCFGDEDPPTACAKNGLALLLLEMQRLAEAEPLFREAVETAKRVRGEEHPDTLKHMDGLVRALQEMQRYDEAEPLLAEILSIRRRNLPEGHTKITSSLVLLGLNLVEQEKYYEAEPLLRESLEIRQKALPEGHWLIANTMSLLGASLAGQEQFDEAEPLLLEAYERMQPPAQWIVRKQQALERIVQLYEAWDTAEPGQGYAEQAAEWRAGLPTTQPSPEANDD